MIALFPLAAVGTALYLLPYQLPRLVARRADDPDVVSTLKLGTGLVAYPVWAGLLTVGAFVWSPVPLAAAATAANLVTPFAALAWHDRTPAIPARAAHVAKERAG